ncbi:outer membrane protein assembly factor BamE [Allopusillimonas soli]|uniref:Outer membrane protein assembly factor BamE n=1 Tax=Allopusillimonas soli TaxID=659016 RepID=A0A853FDP2_9BURK|nr:outer membrane protein assembly factor BamE [Allopusillimonas soli]TEA72224.1 outer membrane protein assembly factor BamE [Allopusillimonas soli]
MLATTLAACGTANWGFPYRPDVQQGNWLTSEQVAQLRQGMTRDQVRFILGTPTLQDIFHSNRWDYPYYNQPGYGKEQLRNFTVWFDGDQLVRWSGDEQPDRQPFERTDTGMTPPDGEEKDRDTAQTQAEPAAAADATAQASQTPDAESMAIPDATPLAPASGALIDGSQVTLPESADAAASGQPAATGDAPPPAPSIQETEAAIQAEKDKAEERRSGPRRPLLNNPDAPRNPPGSYIPGQRANEPLR